uniref:27 kDa hemolymph protein n=2 Tax=Graphocephala atropunctata TaxID=36148 RepID=A0A1B6LB09_9HEMI
MKNLLIISSLLLMVSAFDENTLDVAKQKLAEGLDQLPDSVKSAIPQDLSVDQVPSVEEGEELLKERCDKYGTNESFDNAMYAKEEIIFCLRKLINYTELQTEIELAKPTGDLDIVFKKYCRKAPQLQDCVTNFTEAIEPCLSLDERYMKQTITNITDALVRFVCYKEGERIALFIAEGGPECLKDNQDQIQQCVNSTFSRYLPKDVTVQKEEPPLFQLGKKECGDISKLQQCVVEHLEKCSEPTPSNVVDSLIAYVRKVTPCQQYEPNDASTLPINSVVALSAIVALVRQLH